MNQHEMQGGLLDRIEAEIERKGGYKLFKLEALLENKINKFSPESMQLKKQIRELNEANSRKRRSNN